MSRMKREIGIEILVGLFIFIVLITLSLFTIVLSKEQWWEKRYEYDFVFTEIGGLREGDNVHLRGVKIGRVKATLLEDSNVRVHVTLEEPITLRRGYSIEVNNSSMLGGKFLKIDEGPLNAEELGNNVTILGTAPVDMIAKLGEAVTELQNMIASVGRGEGTLGKLLNDDSVYENMVSVSEDLKKIGDRVEKGEGSLGKLLSDDTVYEDAKAVAENLRSISEGLASGEGTLGKLMSEDSTVYEDLKATMESLQDISDKIKAGEGTLGKLVSDEKLYEEATLLVEDIRAAVDDLREASPVTSFGSVVFGAF